MLQGEKWLRVGHEVQVVSMYGESKAATVYMVYSLQAKAKRSDQVRLHCLLDGKDESDVISGLAQRADSNGELFVIVDEVDGDQFGPFYDKLRERAEVKKVHMWAARIYHNFIPEDFSQFSLTIPLRCPGVVTREVQRSDFLRKYDRVRPYDVNSYPHTDGPLVRELRHEGPLHPDDVEPSDCSACGSQLAEVLKELHVGSSEGRTAHACLTTDSEDTTSPESLQFRDVFVLSASEEPQGFMAGLSQAGIPCRHIRKGDTHGDTRVMREVAMMGGRDAVIVAQPRYVNGLERKVVVWLQSQADDTAVEHFGRLHAFSRSSSQLILVTRPLLPSPSGAKGPEDEGGREGGGDDDVAVMEALLEDLEQQLKTDGLDLDRCDASATVTLTVTFRDGQERVFNVRLDRGRVTLVDSHPERPDGRVRVTSALCVTMVREPFRGVLQIVSEGRLEPYNTPALLHFEPFLGKLRCMLEERQRQRHEESS